MIQLLRSGQKTTAKIFGAWCNGSTPDFEFVDPGSNPGAPANHNVKPTFVTG
jgi:hypothetical protein